MRDGWERTNAAYAWPALCRPARNEPLVYLDLNHWIGLAKAGTGHPDGERHRDAWEIVRRAQAVFPLSTSHFMEMAGIADPRQRHDVAAVMEQLSSFICLMPAMLIMRMEIDAALQRIDPSLSPYYGPIPLLGRGVLQAFGRCGGLRVYSSAGDVTETARQSWPDGPEAFEAWRETAERELDRSVLRGPTDEEAPELGALGWDPTVARRGAEQRAQQEREQAERFAAEPHWRRGRIRDVVAGRYLLTDAQAALAEVLSAHGRRLASIVSDPPSARQFIDSMPSADVRISLLVAAHRNPQTRWTPNDFFDIDAMSIAVPYCDIVVTEKHASHVLHAAGLPALTGATVLTTLDELAERLAEPSLCSDL
jgi:hypothetical protein